MKKLLNYLYNKPTISLSIINIITCIIIIIGINNDNFYSILVLILSIILNKDITDNGVGLTKAKKLSIFMSFFIMIGIIFTLNKYINFFNFY